jgi:hypothetical protein
MSGYLIVMAMLAVALIAVLLAFLYDRDEDALPLDEPLNQPEESESDGAAIAPAPPTERVTSEHGTTSV